MLLEYLEVVHMLQTFQNFHVFHIITLLELVKLVILDTPLQMENALKVLAQLVNIKNMDNVFKTQQDVILIMISLNVQNVQLDIPLTVMDHVIEHHLLVLVEHSLIVPPGLVIKLMTNVNNGIQKDYVQVVWAQVKKQLMENVFQSFLHALINNTSMQKENVLILIHFVILLKKLEVNVLNVYGHMNSALNKENVLKLFALLDMFQTILENVLELVIFALLMMLEEFV